MSENPALPTDIPKLVEMANQLGATNAAVEELNLVIKRLETYIRDAWNRALLARAAAAAQAPQAAAQSL